jgi:hypothetical protein
MKLWRGRLERILINTPLKTLENSIDHWGKWRQAECLTNMAKLKRMFKRIRFSIYKSFCSWVIFAVPFSWPILSSALPMENGVLEHLN